MKKKKLKKSPQKKMRLMVVHGPNLNLLGEREPEIYGSKTLKDLNQQIKAFATQSRCEVKIYQSNSEGSLIDFIHKNRKWAQGLVINPGAYTHYSYAIRDAISGVGLPAVEVHLSDISKREDFRKISVIAPVCKTQFSGEGFASYLQGIEYLLRGFSV